VRQSTRRSATLRRVMIHDQRDAIASRLVRYRDERGDDWADIIDMLTMSGNAAKRCVLMGAVRQLQTRLTLRRRAPT
jgi:hypothetical protein